MLPCKVNASSDGTNKGNPQMANSTELTLPTDKIRAYVAEATGHIVFNNPERHNAVSLEMWDAVETVSYTHLTLPTKA